jgi:hypothetical protein
MPEARDKAPESTPQTSSVPQLLPAKQESLFREVLTLLNDLAIPYAVSGAFALQLHTGICRFTKDLDVFLDAKDVPKALSALEGDGFECEVPDPVWLAKAHRDEFFVDLITGMSSAVVRVDNSWIRNACAATVVGVKTKVLAPEELIASKIFVTRRERFDGADIVHIIYATCGQLNWERLLELAGEHWEILFWPLILFHYTYPTHPGYVPQQVWRELLSRFSDAIAQDRPDLQFRGSLIDENMFAIDVREWGLANLLESYRQQAPKIQLAPKMGCKPTKKSA